MTTTPTTRTASAEVVLSAPMSYTGSARRLWKMTRTARPLTIPLALLVIPTAWLLVTAWYAVFGLFMAPYRLVRRWQRKRKVARLRHAELLAALEARP